ncbi:MAG TPA: hypothetical protein VL463_36035 [Kofleriaceae bacterium]|nr:hypothetical protein [Kofleriaceae bacterium]
MIERLLGAVVAIAAAGLLVAGLVTSAWWAGQTTAGGAQDVTIGLRSEQVCFTQHSASGKPRCTATTTTDCDSSATVTCKSRGTFAHDAIFGGAGWGATIFGALAALCAVIAGAGAMSRGKASARGAAGAAGFLGGMAGVCAAVFIVMRPGMTGVEGEIGWAAWAFAAGAGGAVIGSILLRLPDRERAPARVHAHAPRGPVAAPRGMDFDVGALFGEDEASAKPPSFDSGPSDLRSGRTEGMFPPEEHTDRDAVPPALLIPKARPAPPTKPPPPPASEVRADTEKDLPPDDMQGTPAPAPKPVVFPPAPPPVRAKPASLPPLPLPRTKPPSLPPPFKPPAIPTGTGASPRVMPEGSKPPPIVATSAGPVPACPQCDSPTMWNEEHLRFYCKKCRIYL